MYTLPTFSKSCQKMGHIFRYPQKSKSRLEFLAHICWVIIVDYKVRLGQVKSEFYLEKTKIDSFHLGFKIVHISHKILQCALVWVLILLGIIQESQVSKKVDCPQLSPTVCHAPKVLKHTHISFRPTRLSCTLQDKQNNHGAN